MKFLISQFSCICAPFEKRERGVEQGKMEKEREEKVK
jgi:hypothetical protein